MSKINYILVGLFFVMGCLSQTQGQTKDTVVKDAEVFSVVEIMPEFPGGEEARMKFLHDNLKYPEELRDSAIAGRVMIGFVVEVDGSITNVEVVRSVHELLDAEAVRVTKLMPNWKPAMQRGKPVRVRFRMPINFTIK